MAEVTYFVALPFVAADDGVAAGEPTECFSRSCARKLCRASRDILAPWRLAEQEIRPPATSAMRR